MAETALLVAILGPTGSGKSELALRVCKEFQGEVVNCDSLQLYRHFDIGTAKLSPEQRLGIPHHLIDVIDPDQVFTAGEYARRARVVLCDIRGRGKLPVVAGGTGFYLRALIDGLFPGPSRNDALRGRLAGRQQRRPGSLHRILARWDPESAAKIHANDVPKLIRTLEICLLTRQRASEMFRKGREALESFRVLKVGLFPPRDSLYEILDRRCEQMFQAGLLEEVKRILSLGFCEQAKPFESHGYRQALQVLRCELTLDEAVFYTRRNTRRYAKRQFTWFRQEPGIEYFRGFGSDPDIQSAVLDRVVNFLADHGTDSSFGRIRALDQKSI